MLDGEKLVLLEAACGRFLEVIDSICGGLEGGAFRNCGEGFRDCQPCEEKTQCPYESARQALELVLAQKTDRQRLAEERWDQLGLVYQAHDAKMAAEKES